MNKKLKADSGNGYSRKTTCRSLCLAAGCMLALLSVAPAAVVYTSSYDGSVLPTATAGTAANPKWSIVASSGTFSTGNTGGVLNAVTTGTASMQAWAVGTSSGTPYSGSTAGVWSTSTATVDFSLQVISGVGGNAATGNGFGIQLSDASNRFYGFYIGPTAIFAQTGASTGISISTASLGLDTSDFNTYRVVMDAGKASLYVNDDSTPIFSMVSGFTLGATRTALLFGDFSSSESGSYNLDYLSWSNTTAEFAAPIPEPTAAALAGLVGVCGVVFRRRRSI